MERLRDGCELTMPLLKFDGHDWQRTRFRSVVVEVLSSFQRTDITPDFRVKLLPFR